MDKQYCNICTNKHRNNAPYVRHFKPQVIHFKPTFEGQFHLSKWKFFSLQKKTPEQNFNSFSIIFYYCIISTTYSKIGDLYCPVHISGTLHGMVLLYQFGSFQRLQNCGHTNKELKKTDASRRKLTCLTPDDDDNKSPLKSA